MHQRALAAGRAGVPARHLPRRAGQAAPPAFVLGYGSVPPDRAELGIRLLAESIADLL